MRQQDQCKIEIVRHKHTPSPTPTPNRKLSAEGRRTETSSKQRDSIKIRESPLTPGVPQRYREGQAQQSSCLNTIFHKEKEYHDFAEKCFNYLSRKKLGEAESRPNTFCTMLQNIKKSIKETERREKEGQDREDAPLNDQNDLICVRSQIHQIYNSQDQKIELYKMIKSNETRPSRARSHRDAATIDPSARYAMNPFQSNRTIVCFTMALNEPQVQKKPLFEVPLVRATSTSVGKRVVAISKSQQPRGMCFQLSGDADGQYSRKLKNFLDFLFKVNYSNNLYLPFELARNDDAPRFRAYVGRGNNSLLVKSLIKRRFWWEVVDQPDGNLHFYWSQNIVDSVHAGQQVSQRAQRGEERLPRKKPQDDALDLNRKILPADKCQSVERFILKEGYVVPFEAFQPDLLSNHLPRNYCIGSKKNLFRSLSHFLLQRGKDPFDFIPRTYHLRSADSPEFKQFARENQGEPDRVWIVKPGENSNRGNGITLSTFSGIQGRLRKAKHENGQAITYIVQSYINRPFLYCGRKFDIRHYLLLTSVNGLLKAYWYRDGYIRTSSEPFDLEDLDNPFVHLTNDAVQRRSQDYQKYEPANKLSYSEFQRYLDYAYTARNLSLERDVLPRMKELACYVVRANCATIDHRRHRNNFEIFGLDFMIDREFKTWLIEVNYNPCLEVNCPVLERIIPAMVENSFRVGLDPLFPPTTHFPPSRRFTLADHYLRNLRYELIFDEQASAAPDYHYGFEEEQEQEEEYLDEGREVDELQL